MRYKPKSIAALQMALGGLPDAMHVEADRGIGVSAKTVGSGRLRFGLARAEGRPTSQGSGVA